jgi:hypothetical protein
MTLADKVNKKLDELDAAFDQAKAEFLQPLVEQEFARVQKKNRHITGIYFGNGTWLLDVDESISDDDRFRLSGSFLLRSIL